MNIYDFFENLFNKTAWRMVPPEPYSRFHIILTVFGVVSAVFLARCAARSALRAKESPAAADRVLLSCGLLLGGMEIYKQGFLYFVENGGYFNWWYFPFQLCSIPMYLGLICPFMPSGSIKRILAGFIRDFGLLGGIMALAVPPGLIHPYWSMTLHGFFWHFILIFMGFFCAFSRLSEPGFPGFLHILPLFFTCCLFAIAINVLAGPGADADMFYLSPYHPSSQPVFHQISITLGIFPGLLIYISAMILGGFTVHIVLDTFLRPREK